MSSILGRKNFAPVISCTSCCWENGLSWQPLIRFVLAGFLSSILHVPCLLEFTMLKRHLVLKFTLVLLISIV